MDLAVTDGAGTRGMTNRRPASPSQCRPVAHPEVHQMHSKSPSQLQIVPRQTLTLARIP